MSRNLTILNLLSVILVIIVNYISQTLQFNNNTIGSLSQEYRNLFTPQGYAFSIWGIIFIALLVYCGYQIYCAFFSERDADFIAQTGPWFALANFANAGWVVVWLFEFTGLSVIFMFVILFSLIMVIRNTRMEKWDAPFSTIAFTWWPICLYAGWITVATIANVASFLSKIGWDGWIFTERQWTIIMILVAVFINLLIIYRRNMREFAAVGIWALIAIYVRHSYRMPIIGYVALGGAVIIGIYALYHGYINRKTNPMYKLVKGDHRE
ncbi:tryptophan-rich sensory protein [Antarcticibacterium arcticum]|uniref:Tryptophan-rich sensory protein n=1 Tax=Antarcticibacterium arcticum TaxID=2585771 RepID=A0A5B8YP81_9FLAO|nr:tryptophan-rich sensory protein [Antarcticibacterium arcticum]QED38687.1 tryptophan-rich sensory protein [Antarcticibacterium arcticum]